MKNNKCPICTKPLYSKMDFFDHEAYDESKDYSKYALPNWPDPKTAEGADRAKPSKDNA